MRCSLVKLVVLVHVLREMTALISLHRNNLRAVRLAIDCAHLLLDPLLCPLGNFSTRTFNCYLRRFDDNQVVRFMDLRAALLRRSNLGVLVRQMDIRAAPPVIHLMYCITHG